MTLARDERRGACSTIPILPAASDWRRAFGHARRVRGAFGALHQSCGRLARGWCLERRLTMLIIYQVVLSFVEDVALLTPRIAHHDPDLARQLRRAYSSVAL